MAEKIVFDINYFKDRVTLDTKWCWNWTLKKDKSRIWLASLNLDWKKKTYRVPRLVYELVNWEIWDINIFVIHKCWNNSCCNPEHLKLGNPKKLSENNINLKKLENKQKPHYWNTFWNKKVIAWGIKFDSFTDAWKHFWISVNWIKKRIKLWWDWYKNV